MTDVSGRTPFSEPVEGSTAAASTRSAHLRGRTVLVAGATSASGRAVARALLAGGARVVVVGSDRGRIEALEADLSELAPDSARLVAETADLTDEDAVLELAMRVHARVGAVDGVVHLVGGWRGGGGIPGQSDEDYRFLERSFTALRHVSRAFWDDLVASTAGRIAIVSSATVLAPTAGGANYTAVKAASESWMRSLAQGFAKADAPAAAVIYRVSSLAGLEGRLAESVAGLWAADASELNGLVETLSGSASGD